ncbi:MAG: hypothetical protein QOF96_3274 [Actinomycetota bacterium]|nr:hypothetical protein [Actinomycetota bacterium]
MLGDIRRFGRSGRASGGTVLVLLVTAGFTGVVLARRPPGNGRAPQAVGAGLPRASVPIVEEHGSPRPDPAPSPLPPSVPVTSPAAPVASVAPPFAPAVSPPSPSVASVPVRPPAARRDAASWIASTAPLEASPPVRVEIAAVGVSALVGPLGLNRDGTLEVPADFSRAGWYTGRPTPGEAGPAIIVAHRASRRGPGAFWKLPDVQPGQEIVITRTDGRRVRFTVDRVEQHRKAAFPTGAVYGPTPENTLRLVTCGGPFEPALGDHYRDNVIVFARMTGWAA